MDRGVAPPDVNIFGILDERRERENNTHKRAYRRNENDAESEFVSRGQFIRLKSTT